jgi:excisionase family DNA binding protein
MGKTRGDPGTGDINLSLPPFYTPEEAATKLKVTRRAVYQWLLSGKLKGLRVGQHWRISENDLLEFMQRAPLTKVVDHKV